MGGMLLKGGNRKTYDSEIHILEKHICIILKELEKKKPHQHICKVSLSQEKEKVQICSKWNKTEDISKDAPDWRGRLSKVAASRCGALVVGTTQHAEDQSHPICADICFGC